MGKNRNHLSEAHPVLKRVSLRRTMCYGHCPVYEVIIHGDGRVCWNGERFVSKEGPHEWQISKRRLTALVKAIEKVDYFNLNWEKEGPFATDDASAITSVEFHDGRSREIDHYLGDYSPPEILEKLEKTIDRLAGTAPYIRGR